MALARVRHACFALLFAWPAAPVSAGAETFLVIDQDDRRAHVASLSIRSAPDGARVLDLWGAAAQPGGDPPATYLKFSYGFDCKGARVRAEEVVAYDAAFRPVFRNPSRSPWRALPGDRQMPLLFKLACAPPGDAPAAAVSAPSAQAMLVEVRRRRGWSP
ncbi:hypothetical protein [Phenylobacterium sp.]|jgi:hypothetical protein|uniref:hypothetical protein n=1 Tax=Phenylobacterium sp. TaxID=1871053 RepID=UPI002F95205E